MLRLKSGDVGHGCEDVARVSGSTLNAIPVVDAALSRLGVDVKVLEVVVEVNRAGTEISPQKSGMSREDGGNIDSSLLRKGQSHTGQPLVEVSDDGLLLLMAYKLLACQRQPVKR